MYAYAANNPVKYTDPDGRQACPCEIEEVEQGYRLVSEIAKNPVAQSLFASVAVNILEPLFIGLFIFCLTGDSISPALPPNYYKDSSGNIYAENGIVFATVNQAWKHSEGKSDWNEVEGWGKGTFETANKSLLYHFEKHGKEVGALSPEQYLNKAKEFKRNLKRTKGGPIPSFDNHSGEQTGWKYIKNGKYIILDLEKKNILSFGTLNHED